MGSAATSTDLALDLRPPSSSAAAAARGVTTGLLREAAAAGDQGRAAKLEEYLRGLEEERRKIEGFRRELPLCMLILSDVIEAVKEEVVQCKGGEAIAGGRPVLEEFMPMNGKLEEEEEEEDDGGVKQEDDFRDKVSWMSSAQLWSADVNHSANTSSTTSTTVVTCNNDASSSNSRENTRERAEINGRRPQGDDENPFTESKYRSDSVGGGAFLPFKVLSSSYPAAGSSRKEEKAAAAAIIPLSDLSLHSPAAKTFRGHAPSITAEDQRSGGSSSRCSSREVVTSSAANAQSSPQPPAPPSQQAPRKPRRCWSPELHRRFVKALQQLGGSQAATPKQIRELMKVDGLTNDEVKSHLQLFVPVRLLQKYRLHTRRTPSAAANQQVVVLGGLWVSPENYPPSKHSTTSHSGSPQGPLHRPSGGSDRPAVSLTGGDSCEEEEDGKSESYSWKGHLQRSNGEETD